MAHTQLNKFIILSLFLVSSAATQLYAQEPQRFDSTVRMNPASYRRIEQQEQEDKNWKLYDSLLKDKSFQALARSSGPPAVLLTPTGDISFMNGETNMTLKAGLQYTLGYKNYLPDVYFLFDHRLPFKLFHKRPWMLDNVSVAARFSLAGPSGSDLTKVGIGYAANALLKNPVTDFIGFQGFKNPSISDLFSLSTAQGALTLNLVRNKTKINRTFFITANWSLLGSYTPVKAESHVDDVSDLLENVNDLINESYNSLSNPITALLSGDSLRNDIRKLTNISNSLKEIVKTVVFKNLGQEFIPALLDHAGIGEDEEPETDPIVLFYTGPSVSLGFSLPEAKPFYLSVYGQYLFSLTKQTVHNELYALQGESKLDTADNYINLFKKLGIGYQDRAEVETTREYNSSLIVLGAQLSAEFYAINFYIAGQGIKQKNEIRSAAMFKADDKDWLITCSVGMGLNLAKVFKKPKKTDWGVIEK